MLSAYQVLMKLEEILSKGIIDESQISFDVQDDDMSRFLNEISCEEFKNLCKTSKIFRKNFYRTVMFRDSAFNYIIGKFMHSSFSEIYFNWILYDKIAGLRDEYNFNSTNWLAFLCDTDKLDLILDEILEKILKLPTLFISRIFEYDYYGYACKLYFSNFEHRGKAMRKLEIERENECVYRNSKMRFIITSSTHPIIECWNKHEYPAVEFDIKSYTIYVRAGFNSNDIKEIPENFDFSNFRNFKFSHKRYPGVHFKLKDPV